MGEINWQTISCNVKLTYKSSLQEKKGVFLRGNLGHRGTAQCRVSEPRQGEHGVHAWEWGWAWGESELGEASVWEGRYPHVGSMPKQGEEASTWGKEQGWPHPAKDVRAQAEGYLLTKEERAWWQQAIHYTYTQGLRTDKHIKDVVGEGKSTLWVKVITYNEPLHKTRLEDIHVNSWLSI